MIFCKNIWFWVEIHKVDHAVVGNVGEGGAWNHENTYKTNIQPLKKNNNDQFKKKKKKVFKDSLYFAKKVDLH